MVLKIQGLTNLVKDTQKERNLFVTALDKCRGDIKDFEKLITEQRAVSEASMIGHRLEIAKALSSVDSSMTELQQDRQQLKSMVKNQNYHYTEIQKHLGVLSYRMTDLEKITSQVPALFSQLNATDTYLNLYQPMEICSAIHNAIQASLSSAPCRQRLDAIEYSVSRVQQILTKIN